MVKGASLNGVDDNSTPISYTQLFDELCPEYLAMGMTYDEYWNGSPERIKFYRKAHRERKKLMNQQMWMQGRYVYDAILCIAPILIPFNKNAKLQPYIEDPYPLSQKEAEKLEEEKARREYLKSLEDTKAWAERTQEKFRKKGDSNG